MRLARETQSSGWLGWFMEVNEIGSRKWRQDNKLREIRIPVMKQKPRWHMMMSQEH